MERAEEYNLQLLRKPFHAQELFDAVTALASGEFGQRSQGDGDAGDAR